MFKPSGNWIAVIRDDVDVSKGGILLPLNQKSSKYPPSGTVAAIGPGEIQKDGSRYQFTVKVGDRVAFSPNVGEGRFALEVEHDGEKYVMLKEAVIYGIMGE